MLTYMLNAPIAELPMSKYINFRQHFLNCGALLAGQPEFLMQEQRQLITS